MSVNDDGGTFVMEAARDGTADATRCASDDARLVLQSLHDVLETRVQAADRSASVCFPALAVTLDHFESSQERDQPMALRRSSQFPINDRISGMSGLGRIPVRLPYSGEDAKLPFLSAQTIGRRAFEIGPAG
jgi:hypothetical protein